MNLNKPKIHANSYLFISKIAFTFFYLTLLLYFSLVPLSKINGQVVALNLDGTNDYVGSVVNELSTGNPVHTIEALIYIDALPANRSWPLNFGQFSTGSHHWLLESDGDFVVGVFAGAQIITNLPIQQWVHVAAVYDGINLTVYINGSLRGSTPASFNFWNQNFHLGHPWANPGENYFDGSIDQVRIWNVTRTAAQIDYYQNRDLTASESGLIAYYNFNEGTPDGNNQGLTTISDGSGEGNTGTVHNLAGTGTSSNWVNSLCPVPGTECNDGDPNTSGDSYDGNCNCIGYCDLIGMSCDDGDDQTINSFYTSDDGISCECIGFRGCIVGNLSGGIGGQFTILDQLCCSVSADGLSGEVHVTLEGLEHIYPQLGFAQCNGTSNAVVVRGTRNFRRTSIAQSRNNNTNDRLLYEQTWFIKGSGPCAGETYATLEVHVYLPNNSENLVLTENTILSDTLAANTITASGTIPNSEEVIFLGGTSITLTPGFTVEKNASFIATIASDVDCSNIASFTEKVTPVTQRIKVENKALTKSSSLTVYPNPFSTFTTIDYQLTKPTTVTLSIISLTGQIIKRLEMHTSKYSGHHSLTLDNTNLAKGIYLVKLQTDTERLVQKVIVQ